MKNLEKNKRIKVIHISTASSSFSVKDYEEDIFKAWYAQTCYQIRKYYPLMNVEGWTIERKYRAEEVSEMNDVRIRIFPTEIAVRHGFEISFSLIKALIEEQEKAVKNGEKLIVHIHEHHTWMSYLILMFLNKKKCRIISQHHGARSMFQNLKKYWKLWFFLPGVILMEFLERLLFKKIDNVYCASEEDLNYMKKISPNVKFKTLGIGNEYFKYFDKDKSRAGLGFKKDVKYLLFLGRITTKKGIGELLEAMNNLKEEKIKLFLIGWGEDYEYYRKFAENNRIDNVEFLGSIYDERKFLYLAGCDALILPSYTESCPIVLMEAIAMNLLVIASKVGGIPMIIENGREGILIEPKSSREIVKAIKEIIKWKKKEIRQYAEKYRWEKIIKETVENYEN